MDIYEVVKVSGIVKVTGQSPWKGNKTQTFVILPFPNHSKQIFRAVKLFRNIGLWHEVLSAKALAPLALGDVLEKTVAPALENRISNSSDRKTIVEVLSTLEAVVSATPPTFLMEKIVPLQSVFKLLDRISKTPESSGGGPVLTTVNRLKTAFGGSPV